MKKSELEEKLRKFHRLEKIIEDLTVMKKKLKDLSHKDKNIFEEIKEDNINMREKDDEINEKENIKIIKENFKKDEKEVEELIYSNREPNDVDSIYEEELLSLEDFNNMKEDYQELPFCAEKLILELIIMLYQFVYFSHKSSQPQAFDSHLFEEKLEKFKNQMLLEENLNILIREYLAKALQSVLSENFKEALNNLSKILKEWIRKLNPNEIKRIIAKNKEMEKYLIDKDVVLLLGRTGAGKSTMILFLTGCKMIYKKVLVDGYEFNTIDAQDKSFINQLAKVKSSYHTKSETKFLTLIPISNSQYKKIMGDENEIDSENLLDSPGIDDTGGAEINIANGIATLDGLKVCKSVRVLLLITYKKMGTRGEGIRELYEMLNGLLPDFQESLKSFHFVFSHCTKEDFKNLPAFINIFRKDMKPEERDDENLNRLLNKLKDDVESDSSYVDLINGNPKAILKQLKRLNRIKYPSESFRFTISDASKGKLKKQINMYYNSIINSCQRNDFNFAKYRLDKMKYLVDLLNLDYLKIKYEESCADAASLMEKSYSEKINQFNRCMKSDNLLTQDDIDHYKEYIQVAESFENFRLSHLSKSKENLEKSLFLYNLSEQMNKLWEEIASLDILDNKFKSIYQKFLLITTSFPQFQNFLEKSQAILYSYIGERKLESQKALKTRKVDDFSRSITKIKTINSNLKEYFKDKNGSYESLITEFLDKLKKAQKNIHSFFQQEMLEEKDLHLIKNEILLLEECKGDFLLQQHIETSKIEDFYRFCLSDIISNFTKMRDSLEAIFKFETYPESERLQKISSIEKNLFQMKYIKTISCSVSSEVSDLYMEVLQKLQSICYSMNSDIGKMLDNISQNQAISTTNVSRMIIYIKNFKAMDWIDKYLPGTHNEWLNNIDSTILEHISSIYQKLTSFHLNMENSQEFIKFASLYTDFLKSKPLEKEIQNVGEIMEKGEKFVDELLDRQFTQIIRIYEKKDPKINFKKINDSLEFLNAFQSTQLLLKNKAESIKESLIDFINNYQDSLEETFILNMDKLKKEEELIQDYAFIIQVLLKDLEKIKGFNHIFEIFKNHKENMLDDCFTILEIFAIDFNNKLVSLNPKFKLIEIQKMLEKAKILVILDPFLPLNKKSFFQDAFKKNQSILTENLPKNIQECFQIFKEGEYSEFLRKWNDLSSLNSMESQTELSTLCKKHIANILKETRNNAKIRINFDDANNFHLNNERMNTIENIVHDTFYKIQTLFRDQKIFEDLDIDKNIDSMIRDLRRNLSSNIKEIETSIRKCDLELFENQLEHLKSLVSSLQLISGCDENEIIQKINSLEDMRNKFLEDSEENISKINIEELNCRTNIRNYISMIFQISEKSHSPVYKETMEKIYLILLEKYKTELENLEKKYLTPEKIETSLKNLEDKINQLPNLVKDEILAEIRNFKKKKHYFYEEISHKLNTLIQNNQVEEIISKIKEIHEKKIHIFDETIILKYYNESFLKPFEQLQASLKNGYIEGIPKEIENNLSFIQKFSQIQIFDLYGKQNESKILTLIFPYLMNHLEKITNLFSFNPHKSHEDIPLDNELKDLENSFHFIIKIMIISDHFNLEEIKSVISATFEKINDFIKSYKNKMTESDEKEDFKPEILRPCLNYLEKCDGLLGFLKRNESNQINCTFMKEFFEILGNIPKYNDFCEKIKIVIKQNLEYILNIDISQNFTSEKTMEIFIQNLQIKIEKFNFMVRTLSDHFPDLLDSQVKISENLIEKIEKLSERCDSLLSDSSNLKNSDLQDILSKFSIFKSFLSKIIKINFDSYINKIKSKVENEIKNKFQLLSKQKEDQIPKTLVELKRISFSTHFAKKQIDDSIDSFLSLYKEKNGGENGLKLLANKLKSEPLGGIIISNHSIFAGLSLKIWNDKIPRLPIDQVLKEFDGHNLNKKKLKEKYQEFDSFYEELIKKYLSNDYEVSSKKLAIKICNFISNFGNNGPWGAFIKLKESFKDTMKGIFFKPNVDVKIKWGGEIKGALPKIIAYIFALYTIMNSKSYFECDGDKSCLFKPLSSQVLSILRVFSIGDDPNELVNNLIQIGTGEGKSVTLAVTSTIFALLGFEVHCACYSEHLSHRDFQSFFKLFDFLNATQYIHYGSFNKVCERLINKNGDVRKNVEELISRGKGGNNALVNGAKNPFRPFILLIDEVDTFFGKNFYGQSYTPSATILKPEIKALVQYIYSNRNNHLKFNDVAKENCFIECKNSFGEWDFLVDEMLKSLLADLNTFQDHGYIIKDNQICYKEGDSISSNIQIGYKTLFAYLYEIENKKIIKSESELNELYAMNVNCGDFSYADLPDNYHFIMGVTGTLKSLTEGEKKTIKDYNIHKETYSPSVYGDQRLNLDYAEEKDIRVCKEESYYLMEIARTIDERMNRNKQPVAVIVVFEDKKKLMNFYNHEYFDKFRKGSSILTEEANFSEIEAIVSQATLQEKITLISNEFARGVNFVCTDENVNKNGGVVIIQTYYSKEKSEQIQVMGRTARQGQRGVYCMVLLESELEYFNVTKEDIEKHKTKLDTFLSMKREERSKQEYENNKKYVENAREKHKKSMKLLDALYSGDNDYIKSFLKEENQGPPIEITLKESRTIILCDGTGSMSSLFKKSKATISKTFEGTQKSLQEGGASPNLFFVKYVVYRNYNCKADDLLVYSSWENNATILRNFINNIDVKGGWGNEAIEIAFAHANENEDVSQIILIGDAASNSEEEVLRKRKDLGESYWSGTKYAAPTNYKNEMQKLKDRNIKVHAFYVNARAKQNFEEIASFTGGTSQFLDVNSEKGSEMLTKMIAEEILRNVGEKNGEGNKYVEIFKKSYK